MSDDRIPTHPAGVLCEEQGEVAVCESCATDLHSPYWSARKSAALHRRGMGHKVRVLHGSDVFMSNRVDR